MATLDDLSSFVHAPRARDQRTHAAAAFHSTHAAVAFMDAMPEGNTPSGKSELKPAAIAEQPAPQPSVATASKKTPEESWGPFKGPRHFARYLAMLQLSNAARETKQRASSDAHVASRGPPRYVDDDEMFDDTLGPASDNDDDDYGVDDDGYYDDEQAFEPATQDDGGEQYSDYGDDDDDDAAYGYDDGDEGEYDTQGQYDEATGVRPVMQQHGNGMAMRRPMHAATSGRARTPVSRPSRPAPPMRASRPQHAAPPRRPLARTTSSPQRTRQQHPQPQHPQPQHRPRTPQQQRSRTPQQRQTQRPQQQQQQRPQRRLHLSRSDADTYTNMTDAAAMLNSRFDGVVTKLLDVYNKASAANQTVRTVHTIETKNAVVHFALVRADDTPLFIALHAAKFTTASCDETQSMRVALLQALAESRVYARVAFPDTNLYNITETEHQQRSALYNAASAPVIARHNMVMHVAARSPHSHPAFVWNEVVNGDNRAFQTAPVPSTARS